MPEKDHVTGIQGHDEIVGPPYYPPSESVNLPPWDQFEHGVLPKGDPDATSKNYFIEVNSPYLEDVQKRTAEFFPRELDDDDEYYESGGS